MEDQGFDKGSYLKPIDVAEKFLVFKIIETVIGDKPLF
jgi:hypothetical protein